MSKTNLRFIIIALGLLVLMGCDGFRRDHVVEVKVPVPVPCKVAPIEKPAFPLQEAQTSEGFGVKLKKALAEIELRKAYETKLESAVESCQ